MKMKKLMLGISALTLMLCVTPIYAANTSSGQSAGSQQNTGVQPTVMTQTQQRLSPSSTGKTVQNQNQTKVQNEGEDSQIQTSTQEQESQGTDQANQGQGLSNESSSRSAIAKENMSAVASKVEELLTIKMTQGGIGEQVKQIAQEQKFAQQEIGIQLGKVDGRGLLLRSVIGPDFQSLKNMQKIMEQNEIRIQQLTQLQNQLTNQSDITQVQEMIKALTDQNTALQDRISLEEQSGSLLGWLFKLFAK